MYPKDKHGKKTVISRARYPEHVRTLPYDCPIHCSSGTRAVPHGQMDMPKYDIAVHRRQKAKEQP